MSQYTSDKLRILSFVCILLVLYIHSAFHLYSNEILGMTFNIQLQAAANNITQIAVPAFFAISGFLYFRNVECVNDIFAKIKRRCRTLLLPFILAALFFPLFFVTIELIPGVNKFINGSSHISVYQQPPLFLLFKYVFFASRDSYYPIAFHLWFLRDLIIIVFLSPVIYILKKVAKSLTFLFFVIAYCITDGYFQRFMESLMWFMTGACLIPYVIERKSIKLPFLVAVAIVFLISNLVDIAIPLYLLHVVQIFSGLCLMWGAYDYLISPEYELQKHVFAKLVCGYTFFIYLYHEPSLNIVRKILILPFGQTSFSFAFSYLLSPLVFTFLAIIVGWFLKNNIPQFYSVLTGGR